MESALLGSLFLHPRKNPHDGLLYVEVTLTKNNFCDFPQRLP
ncbi:hypothetical protein [Calothrix sp. NIES-2098]